MQRKEYIDKMSEQLKEWDDKIIEMEKNAGSVRTDLKAEYRKQMDDLVKKKENIKSELKDFQEISSDALEELKSGMNRSFRELGESIEMAVKKFNN